MRTGRWRYTRWSDGPAELYDETNDRAETRNLVTDSRHALTIEGLQKRLDEVGPFRPDSADGEKPVRGQH